MHTVVHMHTHTHTHTHHLPRTALSGSVFPAPIPPSVHGFELPPWLNTSLPGKLHKAGVSLARAPVPTSRHMPELQQRGAGRLGRSGLRCAVSAHFLTTPGTPVSQGRAAWTPSIWPGVTQETQHTAGARGWCCSLGTGALGEAGWGEES